MLLSPTAICRGPSGRETLTQQGEIQARVRAWATSLDLQATGSISAQEAGGFILSNAMAVGGRRWYRIQTDVPETFRLAMRIVD
jgi:hypothetical protein